MDSKTFREFGKAAVDFIANYMDNIRERDVLPSVEPGYLRHKLPTVLPEKPEEWKIILEDITNVIIPGLTHWQSPNMHAFYPTQSSFPSIVGEMLSAGFSVIGFSWICSPACTELEVVVMDWLAKFLKLPSDFLHSSVGPGGGIIQGSASESVLVALIASREQSVQRIKAQYPDLSESEIRGKLVAYSSDQSNSCIEKAGKLGSVPTRLIKTDDDLVLRGQHLEKAINDDIGKGYFPIICIATLGTTGTCAYDDIESLGKVCQRHNIWLHVDAAYAGAYFALEECDIDRKGLDLIDSLNFNLHKFLMVNFDCTAMWLRDANKVVDNFNVDRIYLKHNYEGQSQIPDFRHWQIPLGRRFRALKVWITCRTIGAEGFKAYIRNHIKLAERFESYVRKDNRFEIILHRTLGLVCFRAKGDNSRTTNLLQRLTDRKKIYLIQATYLGKNFLRFVVCGMDPKEEDIDFAWNEIQNQLAVILCEEIEHNEIRENNYLETLQQKLENTNLNSLTRKLSSDLNFKSDVSEKNI